MAPTMSGDSLWYTASSSATYPKSSASSHLPAYSTGSATGSGNHKRTSTSGKIEPPRTQSTIRASTASGQPEPSSKPTQASSLGAVQSGSFRTSASRGIASSSVPGSASTNTASNKSHPVLSSSAEKAVIACSVIGGTLIIALIILLLWLRRRRGAKPVITLLRPPSATTFISAKTRDPKLTALPVRRSRSKPSPEIANDPHNSPPPGQDERSPRSSLMRNLWKTANPPTPTQPTFGPAADDQPQPATLKPPEMAQVAGAHIERPSIRLSSYDDPAYAVAESIHAPSTIDLEAMSQLDFPDSRQSLEDGHWSSTTSYATAKSRLDTRSLASTISSLPGIKAVKGWMHGHSDPPNRARQNEAGPSRPGSAAAFLKNKATKPNLAPVPTRELSNRKFSIASSASGQEWPEGDLKEIEGYGSVIPGDGVVS